MRTDFSHGRLGAIVLSVGVALASLLATTQSHPVLAAAATPSAGSPDYQQIIQSEAQYVASAQIHTCQGTPAYAAITLNAMTQSNATSLYISPYRANYGARALIAAGGSYLPLAKDWLSWYMNHANWPDYDGLNGTVYDYTANTTTCTLSVVTQNGHPFYDSTDAYAATWLSAMKAYAVADTGDWPWFRSIDVSQRLGQEAQVAVSTLMPNGLTWATADYHGQYLMDNTEVYQGLKDYVWLLENVFDNAAAASYWQNYVTTIANGIQNSMFADVDQAPGATPMYGWASHVTQTSWSVCYPDAAAQLWTVWTQVGPTSQQQATWAAYKMADSGWTATTPDYPDISCPLHDTEAPAAYAAATVGDRGGVDTWLESSEGNWAGHPYPWTVSDSGFRAMAAQRASTL